MYNVKHFSFDVRTELYVNAKLWWGLVEWELKNVISLLKIFITVVQINATAMILNFD